MSAEDDLRPAPTEAKILVSKNRIFERGRTCLNCRHFEPGAKAIERWRDKCLREDMERLAAQRQLPLYDHGPPQDDASQLQIAKLMARGLTLDEAVHRLLKKKDMSPRDQMRQKLTVDIANGVFGLCDRGVDNEGRPVEYVQRSYLCHRWDGIDGASLATEGHPLDKLGDELTDIADSRARKDPKREK